MCVRVVGMEGTTAELTPVLSALVVCLPKSSQQPFDTGTVISWGTDESVVELVYQAWSL